MDKRTEMDCSQHIGMGINQHISGICCRSRCNHAEKRYTERGNADYRRRWEITRQYDFSKTSDWLTVTNKGVEPVTVNHPGHGGSPSCQHRRFRAGEAVPEAGDEDMIPPSRPILKHASWRGAPWKNT